MEQETNNNYKVALYMRISKEEKHKKGDSASINNQRELLKQYCNDNNFNVCREYADDGISGATFDRPQFNQLMQDIKDKLINLVIVKDLSRFGRDYIDGGQLLERELPRNQCRFIAIGEGIDSINPDSMQLLGMINMYNTWFIKNTSKKIQTIFKSKMKQGKFIGAFAPYGYCKDIRDKNKLVIDNNAADVVKRIFMDAYNGHTPAAIAECLNNEQVVTPIAYRCSNHPKLSIDSYCKRDEWTDGTVRYILNNAVYVGDMVQGKTKAVSYEFKKSVETEPTEWITVKDTHAAIVDRDVFGVVQSMLQGRKTKRKTGFRNIFRGIAFCADCGKAMSSTGTRKKGSLYNLVCGSYKLRGATACSNHFIDYNTLYDIVLQDLRKQVQLTQSQQEEILSDLKKSAKKQPTRTEEIKRIQTNIANNLQKINNVYDDYSDNKITASVKDQLIESIQHRIITFQQNIERLKQDSDNDTMQEHFKELLVQYTDIKELTTTILFNLIVRIEVHQGNCERVGNDYTKQQTIKIYYKFANDAAIIDVVN